MRHLKRTFAEQVTFCDVTNAPVQNHLDQLGVQKAASLMQSVVAKFVRGEHLLSDQKRVKRVVEVFQQEQPHDTFLIVFDGRKKWRLLGFLLRHER